MDVLIKTTRNRVEIKVNSIQFSTKNLITIQADRSLASVLFKNGIRYTKSGNQIKFLIQSSKVQVK